MSIGGRFYARTKKAPIISDGGPFKPSVNYALVLAGALAAALGAAVLTGASVLAVRIA